MLSIHTLVLGVQRARNLDYAYSSTLGVVWIHTTRVVAVCILLYNTFSWRCDRDTVNFELYYYSRVCIIIVCIRSYYYTLHMHS